MESFFELAFPDVTFDTHGEAQVCCPFPHGEGENTYLETNPSMGVNIKKDMYHCFNPSCGKSGNEIKFISETMNITYSEAMELKSILHNNYGEDYEWDINEQNLEINADKLQTLTETYKLSKETIKELRIGFETGKGFAFPVFLFGKIVDVINYSPQKKPKYRKRTGSKNGIIMPYDQWLDSEQPTIVCAGQKDMAIARSLGFNAITITGGEGELPVFFKEKFRDKNVIIVYDNDDAGRIGSNKVATFLKPVVKKIKVVDLSETCTEKGEDLWDYFVKYNKISTDLVKLINKTSEFSEEDYKKEINKMYPLVSLKDASKPIMVGRVVRSNVQVTASFETSFLVPTVLEGIKTFEGTEPKKNKFPKGTKAEWHMHTYNVEELLYLFDNGLKIGKINEYKFNLLKIPKNEENIKLKNVVEDVVYKSVVADTYSHKKLEETSSTNIEFNAYTLSQKLESGKKYMITYKLVPHPLDGQKLVMIILDIEASQDSVSNFKMTDEIKKQLEPFQVTTTLEDKIDELIKRVKGIVKYDYNETILKTVDFWYHTPLQFSTYRGDTVRSYLDTIIVGESRTGKSDTADQLNKMYELGTIVTLAGSQATVQGIIGGSNKVGNSYQTKAGLLPQAHKGAVIFEELSKAKEEIMKELTDVRSSNEVRIQRVSGSLRLPAFVRLLTLSNAKATKSGKPRAISNYPYGIDVITDLIGTAEDIARYDMAVVLADKGNRPIVKEFGALEPLPKENYMTRIRWVWSRTPEQVHLNEELHDYIIDISNKINKKYDTYIKLFGTEAWKKIARLAIAIAGYTVSTDESFENIVVTKEHVNYAANMLVNLYDNPTFKFAQLVAEEKRYSTIDEEGVALLQRLYVMSPTTLNLLESVSETNRNSLQMISGVDNDTFSKLLKQLMTGNFIRLHGHEIEPQERFRKGMEKINKKVKVEEVGETIVKF